MYVNIRKKKERDTCKDVATDCKVRKEKGACKLYPDYMKQNCALTCKMDCAKYIVKNEGVSCWGSTKFDTCYNQAGPCPVFCGMDGGCCKAGMNDEGCGSRGGEKEHVCVNINKPLPPLDKPPLGYAKIEKSCGTG